MGDRSITKMANYAYGYPASVYAGAPGFNDYRAGYPGYAAYDQEAFKKMRDAEEAAYRSHADAEKKAYDEACAAEKKAYEDEKARYEEYMAAHEKAQREAQEAEAELAKKHAELERVAYHGQYNNAYGAYGTGYAPARYAGEYGAYAVPPHAYGSAARFAAPTSYAAPYGHPAAYGSAANFGPYPGYAPGFEGPFTPRGFNPAVQDAPKQQASQASASK